MKVIFRTDVGRVRSRNEDAAVIGDGFFAVCDGMGGHQAGDVASKTAADTIHAELSNKSFAIQNFLEAIRRANEKVYHLSRTEEHLAGMGTTLTAMLVEDEQVVLAQIGDSRAYLFRRGVLRQCTHDHSFVAELVRSGSLSYEDARTHPHKNLITRALGTSAHVEADVFEIGRRAGDRWLLCSDGLTDLVTDIEIQDILYEKKSEEAADELLTLALERGGLDNITFLLIDDEGGAAA